MKRIVYSVSIVLLLQTITILAQSSNPKREFRGAWIATVANIDWPSTTGLPIETLKKQLTDLLDAVKDANLNAVFFQVRPECDALYKSSIEPWSYWITGTQGVPPAGDFDPLKFAIDEAHKRGIELHAWLNPYRARQVSVYTRAANHVTNLHPDWILKFGNLYLLDPGMPQVRNYNVSVIVDIINKYDVDGIHFDDYFYPYPPDQISNQDAATFAAFPRGFTNIGDWRRDNVNIQMKAISDTIKAINPRIKFGISPFGIWKNGVPSGITGMDAYSVIYADPIVWLKQKTVDYIIPQLYWRIGGSQDYNKLMPWWADSAKQYGRHFYSGNIYGSYTTSELPNQLKANRSNSKTNGIVLFSAKHIPSNTLSFTDSLKNKYFTNPALIPGMDWKDQVKPNPPENLRYDKLANARGDGLFWNAPSRASDGDVASMYAVYKFNFPFVNPSDLENSTYLNNIVGTPYAALKTNDVSRTMYFAVTSLDKNYNESTMSLVVPVQVTIPGKPLLISPADLAINQKDTVKLVWENTLHSNYNRLQIATDKNFTNLIVNQNSIVDTFKTVTNLNGLSTYYWRITASNLAGESIFSDVRSFSTGFPVPPQLLLPIDKSYLSAITTKLVWKKSQTAVKYRLQLAEGLSIVPSITILDTVVTDTSLTVSKLKDKKFYTWSVKAVNDFGSSALANVFKFNTGTSTGIEDDVSIPTSYVLNQNYPNPFNPNTIISFFIPENGFTVIKIYNLLGQRVGELINKYLSTGSYSVEFNAENQPSGIYIYVLHSGSQILSKKMLLIK
ncbi:MAG: family 10 glycosylhydrolase [Melioribacteraceae bacterium]